MMNTERPLGFSETFFCIAHDAGCDNNNAAMLVEIEGAINPNIFKQALHQLYLRHPILSASYYKDLETYRYYFQLNIAFDEIDINISESTWFDEQISIGALENAINTIYKPNGRLWCVNLLRATGDRPINYIVFGFHHAIIDGISEIRVIKDFVNYYHAIEQNKILDTPPLKMQLSVNQLLHEKITRAQYEQHYGDIFKQYGTPKELNFEKCVTPFESKTKIMFCDFEHGSLDKIISFAKIYGLKVTAVLSAALLMAIYQVTGHSETLFQVAVNLRHYTQPILSDDIIGCYVQGIRLVMKNIDKYQHLEQLARDYQHQYMQNFKLLYIPPDDFSTQQMEKVVHNLMHKPRDKFALGPTISNWGVVTFNEVSDTLKINAIHRGTGRQCGESAFYLHIATIDNKIQGAFNYPEPYVSQKTMGAIIQAFKKILIQLPG